MVFASLEEFYEKAAACRVLTRTEEKECARRMKDGDLLAQEKLVQSYLPSVAGYIRRQCDMLQGRGIKGGFKMKKNYVVLLIYMAIMAAGLFVCRNFRGTPYTSEDFSEKFLVFMALLTVLVLYYGIKHRGELQLGKKRKPAYLLSSVLFVPVVGFSLYSMVTGFSPDLPFFILIIDTALIGIAEEGMYRGILLGGFVNKMHPVAAILLSSVFFCILHVLNLIGGLSSSEVISQMGSTFVMGMFLGAMYLDTKNIIFPVVFHSAWDYILLSDSLADISFVPIVIIGVYIAEVLITLLIIAKIIRGKEQFCA